MRTGSLVYFPCCRPSRRSALETLEINKIRTGAGRFHHRQPVGQPGPGSPDRDPRTQSRDRRARQKPGCRRRVPDRPPYENSPIRRLRSRRSCCRRNRVEPQRFAARLNQLPEAASGISEKAADFERQVCRDPGPPSPTHQRGARRRREGHRRGPAYHRPRSHDLETL